MAGAFRQARRLKSSTQVDVSRILRTTSLAEGRADERENYLARTALSE